MNRPEANSTPFGFPPWYTQNSHKRKMIASTFTAGLVGTGWPVLQPRSEQAIARVIILRQPRRGVKWWWDQELRADRGLPGSGDLAPTARSENLA